MAPLSAAILRCLACLPVLSLLLAAAGASAPVRSEAWRWPLDPPPVVVRGFDPPDAPWGAGHRGVDLAAVVGQPVRAPTSGRVSFVGSVAGRPVVVVSHGGGLRSTLEPVVASAPVGTSVSPGDIVGTLAPDPGHCHPASCLHWGVLRGPTYLDPLSFVGPRRVVLLPLSMMSGRVRGPPVSASDPPT